jgi:uncharacterized membrane protein
MKIDQNKYPIIIVTALVFFLVLALVLGFNPAH